MIKLSRKTLNSTVTIINKNTKNKLNNESLYYQLEDDFKDELKLEVEENDAFIEFLSDEGDFDILKDVKLKNYEIKKNTTIIKIEKTQKDFIVRLNSDKLFKYSFSYGFSNNENYYYSFNSTPNIIPLKQNNNFSVFFKILTPFKKINLTDKEFFSFSVNIDFESNQKVVLQYEQYSKISPLLDEKLEKKYCEEVKKYLKELFELYVYTDIAKNPPIIEGYPNYHHAPIDIQQSLEDINTENRYFYEFYQEVKKIISATKDYHLHIYSFKTPKGIIFGQYAAALPFIFKIKNNEDEYKIYIEPNKFFDNYEKSVKKFILDHVNIPLRKINEQDSLDYIQNWGKYTVTKNIHAQFTYLMAFNYINKFYLISDPLDYSDLNLNEFEFEDNKILRIPYYIEKPNVKDREFNEFFHNYLKEKKTKANIINIPFIDKIREEYLIHKGLKKKKLKKVKKEEIEWNITIFNDYNEFIKC